MGSSKTRKKWESYEYIYSEEEWRIWGQEKGKIDWKETKDKVTSGEDWLTM